MRADAGLGVEAGNARAARAHPLGERALRAELDLQLAGQILPLELLVLADVGRDHLLHLPGAQQLAEPLIVDAGIVRGDGQVLDPARLDRVDQPLRDAAQAEAARGDGHAVEQQPFERGFGIGIDFLHASLLGSASAAGGNEGQAVRGRGRSSDRQRGCPPRRKPRHPSAPLPRRRCRRAASARRPTRLALPPGR